MNKTFIKESLEVLILKMTSKHYFYYISSMNMK